ncbi:MAG: MFS transporter [Pseudooceanicola sp.]
MERTAAMEPDHARLTDRAHLGAVLVISAGIGMHAFTDLAITASIPIALAELGNIGLIPLTYALFFIGILAGGILSAQIRSGIGARATALTAATCFLAGMTLTAIAPHGLVFALGRAMQGASDGVIAALCYSLIPELFTGALIARVFAVEAVVWALAAALGPVAGGYATEVLGWRAAMIVGLPLALFFLLAAARLLPARATDGQSATPRRIALGPVALCLAGITVLALPAALPDHAWTVAVLPLSLGLVALALRRDGTRGPRFFPSDAFSRSAAGRGMWVMFLMPVAQAASTVFMALMLRQTWGLSPILTGWIVIAMAMHWSLAAFVTTRMPRHLRFAALRHAPGLQAIGLLAVGFGFSGGVLGAVILGHALCGLSFGFSWGPANEVVMETTPPADKSRTASFMPTVQTTGFAVGAALMGWIAVAGHMIAEAPGEASDRGAWAVWGVAAAIALIAQGMARSIKPFP